MTKEYLTYQKFNDQAAAAELAELFQAHKIDFELEDSSLNFDASFSYNDLNKEFRIKIKSEDFKTADNILQQISLAEINQVDSDYYLYQFSKVELMEVVQKADEWSIFDVTLATQLLEKRGVEVQNEMAGFKKARLLSLAEPSTVSAFWLIFFYLTVLFGGIFAMFIGWVIAYQKKTLPNGESTYSYAPAYRSHGFILMLLGGLAFGLTLYFKFSALE